MKTEQVYVLRSADQTTTKIGRTGTLHCRVDAVSIAEKQKYYLLYNTDDMSQYEATELEKDIIQEFAEDAIRGREWLSTHPLKIIKYIVGKKGTRKKLKIELNAKYEWWAGKTNDISRCSYIQDNGVGIMSRSHTAHVRILYEGRRSCIGFANIGDANDFAQKYKHHIQALEIVTEFLYGLSYQEWVNRAKDYKGGQFKKWMLI
jgi:hypothetical protein